MLSITAINKILRRIMETGGLTPSMEEDIKKLQDEFNEREGILKQYGETFDGEDVEDYEFKGKEVEASDEYKSKYEELHQRYLDRFFGGAKEEIMEDNKEDLEEETKNLEKDEESIDSLFE